MLIPDRFTNHLLGLLGLDFEFDMRRKPLSAITETLFVGSRPCPDDTVALKDAGITHVVSCLPERERERVSFLAADFGCLFVPVRDGIHEDIAAAFPKVFDFVASAPNEGAMAKVLVHCEVGVSRSATVAIALLMKSERKSFFDAFAQVRARRAEVLPNIGFASQLQLLEHALHPDLRDSRELSSLARYLRQICNVPVDVELLQEALEQHGYDAPRAIRAIFGDDIPRVVQGVRL